MAIDCNESANGRPINRYEEHRLIASVVSSSGLAVRPASHKRQRGAGDGGVASFELMLVALVVGLLIVIAMPALLQTSPRADNLDAKANLRNAVIEAKGAYYPTQSYSYRGLPLSPLSFAAAAPAFTWTTGSCSSASPDCLSEQVVDVDMPGDSQAVVLATWSSITRTCWFAVDLETVPRALTANRAGMAFETTSRCAISVPGIYYGRSASGATSCAASAAAGDSIHSGWSSSPSTAGVVG